MIRIYRAVNYVQALPLPIQTCLGVFSVLIITACFNNAQFPISKKHSKVKDKPNKEEDDILNCESFIMENPQGIETYIRRWKTERSTNKTVVIVHGLTWHSKYFSPLAKMFQSNGINVIAYDLQGHGKSGTVNGLKAYAYRFDDWVSELSAVVNLVYNLDNEGVEPKKLFLFGESMGAAIVLRALTTNMLRVPISGVLLSGPFTKISPAMLPPFPVLLLVKLFANIFPTASVPSTELNDTFELAFGDSAQAIAAKADPLVVFDSPRLRTSVEIMSTIAANRSKFKSITTPMIVLHGTKDIRCLAEDSEDFISSIASSDKSLHLIDNGFHQLLQDKPEVTKRAMHLFVDWVVTH